MLFMVISLDSSGLYENVWHLFRYQNLLDLHKLNIFLVTAETLN